MDVYDILSRLENITKSLQESSKERVKNDFNKSLGIDKEQYENARRLIDSYQDSEESISQYEKQIKQCDDNLKKFDETIKKLTDNLNKAKKPEDRDKIQNVIDNKKSERKRTAQKRSRLEESLDRETITKNKASSKFKRLTGGKDITQGVAAARAQNKAMKGLSKGRIGSAMKMLGGLKNNPFMAAVGLLIKALEFGIGKATDYMKLNYENLLRQLNASTAVSLNAMKASIASWQDSVTGAYEAQNMAISSQETLLEAQNATELANMKMVNTWTNWIPIWGQINKYQETALELEQKVAQTRLEQAHKIISQVNEFTRKTDEYIKKQDHAIRGFQTDRGMSSTQNATFEKWMLGQGESFAKFNKTIEDVLKMQSSYTEQSGRAVNFSENDNLQSLAVGRLVGDENLINFQSQMQLFNHSVSESADIMYEMYKDVNKMGLSQKKVTKDVLANLKLANKYDFKNGTKGFIELAKWAENARFNLSSLGNIIEKTQSGGLEGAITQSAKLQVLGGNFARYADPLAMFNESLTDPEAYSKRILNMFTGMGKLDRRTGETEFNGADHIRIRAAADALGISVEDAKNMIREDNKKSVVKSQMRSSTLSKKQQDAVANKAQRNEKTGRWYVNTINGDKIDVSDDQKLKANLDNIVSDNKDEAAVQYAQSTLSFVEQIEATTRIIDSKLGNLSFDNFGETVNQSNRNTLDYYSKNIESVISAIQTDRKESIKAQEKLLKKLATIGDKIVKALKTIENPYDGIDMDKEKQKIDIQEAQNKYRRNIKGRKDGDEKWNKTVAVNAMERGGDSGWNWWKNRISSMWERFTNSNEDLDKRARATGYIDKNGKPVEIDEETVKPIHDGVASIAKSDLQDRVVSDNGRPMAIEANKVTPVHDGTVSIAKSDPKDSAIFAKTGGPFDTLFNGVFGRIDEIYNNLSNNSVVPSEPIGKSQFVSSDDRMAFGNGNPMTVSAKTVKSINDGVAKTNPQDSAIFAKTGGPFDTLFNGVFGRIDEIYNNLSNNSVVPSEPIGKSQFVSSDDAMTFGKGNPMTVSANDLASQMDVNAMPTEIIIKPVKVELSGSVRLEANGQSIDLMELLNKNPMLIRQLSQMISDEVGKSINGGRSVTQYDYLRK